MQFRDCSNYFNCVVLNRRRTFELRVAILSMPGRVAVNVPPLFLYNGVVHEHLPTFIEGKSIIENCWFPFIEYVLLFRQKFIIFVAISHSLCKWLILILTNNNITVIINIYVSTTRYMIKNGQIINKIKFPKQPGALSLNISCLYYIIANTF